MAEQSLAANGQRVENVVFALIGRWAIPALYVVATMFGGIVGKQVLERLDKQGDSLSQVQTDIAVMKNDIGYLKEKVRP